MSQHTPFLIVAALALMTSCASSSKHLTVCDLTASPSKYDGKIVTVDAIYISDLRHSSALFDSTCSGVAVDPYGPKGPPDSTFTQFQDAVWGTMRDRSSPIFKVRANGRFEWDATSKKGRFTFDKVLDFKQITRGAAGLGANNSFKPNPLRGSA